MEGMAVSDESAVFTSAFAPVFSAFGSRLLRTLATDPHALVHRMHHACKISRSLSELYSWPIELAPKRLALLLFVLWCSQPSLAAR
jgi:hypothetical protein